jgi:hypothetical protein
VLLGSRCVALRRRVSKVRCERVLWIYVSPHVCVCVCMCGCACGVVCLCVCGPARSWPAIYNNLQNMDYCTATFAHLGNRECPPFTRASTEDRRVPQRCRGTVSESAKSIGRTVCKIRTLCSS